MPSAAGIIIATGAMTLANDVLAKNQPLSTVADKINWKVIPATAIVAGIFYGLEQFDSTLAKGLAALAFFTAFTAPANGDPLQPSPLHTLMNITGTNVNAVP